MTLPNQLPTITSNGGGDTALIAFYSFDETSGPIAHDQQGEHDGTIIGATHVPGVTGNALQFNGSSAYVSVPDSPEWNLGSGDFTIEFWANFNSVPDGSAGNPWGVPIGQDEGGGTQNKWFFEVFSGSIGFHVNNSIGQHFFIAAPFEPTLEQWYSFALTKSGSSYQFYVNGQLVGSANETLAIPDVAAPLTIGQAEGFYFDGQLDGVAFYHRALSQADIQQSYQDGAAAPGAISIPENTAAVTTVAATDPDGGQTLTYSISGGADAAKFAINSTTGALAFLTAPNFEAPTDAGGNNVYDVTVQVSDGNGGLDTQSIAVSVTNQNEAPATAGVTVTMAEDTTYTFALADFPFSDADQPSNNLRHIIISSLPAAGTLAFDSVAITAAQVASGFVIAPSAISAGLLTFVPAADANGSAYAAFDFHVRDDGVGADTAGSWTFSGSGADDSGSDHHLALTGGAGFAPGLFGEALALDGAKASGAVLSTDSSAFDFGSSDLRLSSGSSSIS